MAKTTNPLVVPAQFDKDATGWHGSIGVLPAELGSMATTLSGLFAFGESFHDARLSLARTVWAAVPEDVRAAVDGVRLYTVTRKSFDADTLAAD